MRRTGCILLLLMLTLLLSGCAVSGYSPMDALSTLLPGASGSLPAAVDPMPRVQVQPVTLYFRFWDEPYLACEGRTITRSQSQSFEHALLDALIAGPSGSIPELTSLFPTGTRVLSTSTQGRTLFVTLSKEIMDMYRDEPVDWHEYSYWLHEAPLRRRLCMQSIVATVTENCDIDRVQILVEQQDLVSGSLRLRQNYFLDDSEDDVLVGPMNRNEDLLLNLDNSMQYILTLLREHNWASLYRFLAFSGTERLSYTDAVARLEQLASPAYFSVSSATLSLDGQSATLQVSVTVTDTTLTLQSLPSRILRLTRENGFWRISLEQLEHLMEVNP